jgi:hypothetical protein
MSELVELVNDKGHKAFATEAHLKRYPQLLESFRRVPVKTTPVVKEATPVATQTPTGDTNKES